MDRTGRTGPAVPRTRMRFATLALAVSFALGILGTLGAAASVQAQPHKGGQRHAGPFHPPGGAARERPREDRGRLSPEERRQLRRDIRDAGRDVYGPGK